MCRVLGYNRLISVENFRQPNFPLVAELLTWLVRRYEPHSDLPTDTESESDRIIFIKSVAQFFATKANIKLNTKKLYQADSFVVKELLKMTNILYTALKLNDMNNEDYGSAANVLTSASFDITSQIGDLRRARELASEITTKGATIYDLLGREVDLRDMRTYTINRNLELSDVERGIRDAIRACQREGEKIATQLDNIHSDEKNLDDKIEKKKADLERNLKRLRTLKDVRPAYMDEYESLEKELEALYEDYLIKFRIQSYLEQQLDEYNQQEQEKFEESNRLMQLTIKKLRDQEKERNGNPFLDGEEDLISADSDDEDQLVKGKDANKHGKENGKSQNRNGKVGAANPKSQGKNYGAMDVDLSGSDDDDDDNDDDDDDDDEDDIIEGAGGAARRAQMNEDEDLNPRVAAGKKLMTTAKNDSDSDF